MILAVLTFLLIITVATSVFKDVYAYEPEYAQEDTLFIKTEEPQVNVIPNANTNSSLEYAKHIKQKKKSKKKHKERKGVQFLITAYCPCCDCSDGYGKITSTGKIPNQGRTIAVDPKVIPYGTKVKIKGLRQRQREKEAKNPYAVYDRPRYRNDRDKKQGNSR